MKKTFPLIIFCLFTSFNRAQSKISLKFISDSIDTKNQLFILNKNSKLKIELPKLKDLSIINSHHFRPREVDKYLLNYGEQNFSTKPFDYLIRGSLNYVPSLTIKLGNSGN